MLLLAVFQSMRPRQWTKNLVVFAGVIFSLSLTQLDLVVRSVGGFAIFCVTSGVVYLINDLKDRRQDALHPRKRLRPIASGALPVPMAVVAIAVLTAAALTGSWFLGMAFLRVVIAFLLLNLLYSFLLRKLVILDVMGIATSFVIRAIAGARVLDGAGVHIEISSWLLLCTFFLMLFLGLGKRRNELTAVTAEHRPSLRSYSVELVDRLTGITVASTILCYSIYTIWPGTVEHFGTENLIYTIPFVFYGLTRYLYLVVTEDKGADPSEMLLTDRSIILTVVSWVACVSWILYAS